jgi:hypothetical protein
MVDKKKIEILMGILMVLYKLANLSPDYKKQFVSWEVPFIIYSELSLSSGD